MPREEWKRKRQKQPIQRPKQDRECLPGPSIEKTKRENLTLSDWMAVYAYVDTLPQPINQGKVVKYFATRPEGPLLFSQPTLSRKLRDRSEMEARVDSNPNALSCKRPRVVTRPDVDRELWLWVQQMGRKGEVVNSRMLIAKREVFEEALNVPEDERLPGPGWVQPFFHAYKLKEIGKHGEAGSVDIEIVEKEQAGTIQAEVGSTRGDIEEIDSDSDDDDPEVVPPSLKGMIEACRKLEEDCLLVGAEGALDFIEAGRRLRGRLQKMSRDSTKQTTLDTFFNSK